MKTALRKIHCRIRNCNRCRDILGEKVLPRSGFPPDNRYRAMIIGPEPGTGATGMMTPSQYMKRFMPGARNYNRVRLLFEDLKTVGIDYAIFFYTNVVKCPADPGKGQSKKCIVRCKGHLETQIEAIQPKLIVVIGSAAKYLGLKQALKDSIEDGRYAGVLTLIIRHPQAASRTYRQKVARRIKSYLLA
jgi:uracil-DNA glycosylase